DFKLLCFIEQSSGVIFHNFVVRISDQEFDNVIVDVGRYNGCIRLPFVGVILPDNPGMTPGMSHISARPAGRAGMSRATPATAILSWSPTTRLISGSSMRDSLCMPALS